MLELNSEEETKAVEQYFRKSNILSYNVWLSIKRLLPQTGFRWVSGQAMTVDWRNKRIKVRKSCVYVNMGGYGSRPSRYEMKWIDSDCKVKRNFICMKKG